MENRSDKLDPDNLLIIVNDMINAKFNEQNPLIQNIKNHVNIEQSIMQEIPQVQNKVDLLQYQNDYQNDYQNNSQNDYQNNQQLTNTQENYSIQKQDKHLLLISKIAILTIFVLGIICWILYNYVKYPYNYISMAVSGAVLFTSDLFIYKYFNTK